MAGILGSFVTKPAMAARLGRLSCHLNMARTSAIYYRIRCNNNYQDQQRKSRHFSSSSAMASHPDIYQQVFEKAAVNPEEYWAEQAENIVWFKKWNRVLDDSNSPHTQWFPGGELNVCYNAVDRHVENGRGDQAAVIHDSPITGTQAMYTFSQLQQEVAKLAGALQKRGVGKGDRVLIYMPMIPQAIVSMLAAARLGATHALVFGGFESKMLAIRINHARPKVIMSANCGMEPGRVVNYKPLLDEAIDLSDHKPSSVFVYQRKSHPKFKPVPLTPGLDLDYEEEVDAARPVDCVPVESMHPLYVLYTSGTTGTPKGVVRPSGGHAVTLHWTMKNLYGLEPGEVWWAASDLGWIVGHSYICYSPLLHGNTTIIYEGKPVNTPDAGSFFRVLEEHNVAAMFTAPTALRAIRQVDLHGAHAKKYSFPNFRYLFVAGEHCDHETAVWSKETFKSPVLDNWWQTETGSAITATCVGLGNTLQPPFGVAGLPVPGMQVKVWNEEENKEAKNNELGQILVKLPLPPGSFNTLWRDDLRFRDTYFQKFPGYYDTMDSGFRDEHGNIAVMARADDVINVAGHRLSSGELEEAVLEHLDVIDAAVVGKPDKLKGHVPVGLCVLSSECTKSEAEIKEEVVATVRKIIGPVASFKDAIIVPKLPKTRSGKIARNTLAAMIAGKPYKIPVTIEDDTVYPAIHHILEDQGHIIH